MEAPARFSTTSFIVAAHTILKPGLGYYLREIQYLCNRILISVVVGKNVATYKNLQLLLNVLCSISYNYLQLTLPFQFVFRYVWTYEQTNPNCEKNICKNE